MSASIRTLILASVLLMAPVPAVGDSNAAPPLISRPRPAPDTPPDVPPLPPAQFDPSLAVGGDQVQKLGMLFARETIDPTCGRLIPVYRITLQ